MGVDDQDTFAARLEMLLHERFPNLDLDVINLGVEGYGTRQEVALLTRHVARLAPDLVLVGFYSNDVPDALDDDGPTATGGAQIVANTPKPGQVLRMDLGSTSWLDQLRKSRFLFITGRTVRRFARGGETGLSRFSTELDLLQGKQSATLERGWTNVERQLGVLHSLAGTWRFTVGIVALPCREQVMGEYPSGQYQSRIRAIADRLGFFVVDPLPALTLSTMKKDALFIPYDRNHPSAAGHRIIAQAMFRHLEEHASEVANARDAIQR